MSLSDSRLTNETPNYSAEWVQNYFDPLGKEELRRLTRTVVDRVSLTLHMEMLDRFVPRGASVLELGAGAGRFTKALAEKECEVVVADLSVGQLAENKRFIIEQGLAAAIVDWVQLDICDLGRFADSTFDVVTLFGGPLSYVFDKAPIAVREAVRVVRPSGFVLSSAMSLWGTIHGALDKVLNVPPGINRQITADGNVTAQRIGEGKHYYHLFRAHEYESLHTNAGLQIAEFRSCGGLAMRWGAELEDLTSSDPECWNELLRMEREASASVGLRELGTHLIIAGRKTF